MVLAMSRQSDDKNVPELPTWVVPPGVPINTGNHSMHQFGMMTVVRECVQHTTQL